VHGGCTVVTAVERVSSAAMAESITEKEEVLEEAGVRFPVIFII
tara:strand:+ start:502 stop:633 length:132 start_codon:yes stop_codon:yes gene_type:complete